MYESKKIN